MNRETIMLILRNLAVLALAVFPLCFLLAWLQGLITGMPDTHRIGYMLETGAFYFFSYLGPVLLGGVVHQAMLLMLPRGWPAVRRRLVGALLSVVIPGTVVLLGQPPDVLAWLILPMVLALVVYALLLRLPPTGPAGGNAVTQ